MSGNSRARHEKGKYEGQKIRTTANKRRRMEKELEKNPNNESVRKALAALK